MTAFFRHTPVLTLLVLVLIAMMIAGCTSPSASADSRIPANGSMTINASSVIKVEVFHFHRNQQCASCIAVGDLAEKTVNDNFKDELTWGRLVFAHVNIGQPGNASLAEKYGVTGSSLWIGVYDSNGFYKEQDTRVWSLIDDESLYETYLSGVIAKRLNGDFS